MPYYQVGHKYMNNILRTFESQKYIVSGYIEISYYCSVECTTKNIVNLFLRNNHTIFFHVLILIVNPLCLPKNKIGLIFIN